MHDDDGDDRPRSRRRAWEDDEDDRPSRRPAKAGTALPLILGIVGGVLVLCGGGCASGYFFGIKPALERVKAINEQKQREYEELERREQELLKRPLPPLDPPPRPDLLKPDPAKPNPPKLPPVKPLEVAADDLLDEYIRDAKAAEAKYKDRVVKVTGEVKQATALAVTFADRAGGGFTYQVSATIGSEARGVKAGDTVTVTGKLSSLLTSPARKTKQLRLTDSKLAR